jgi:predicted AlkP superfamily pyrophosphatase or phosphodiesterase
MGPDRRRCNPVCTGLRRVIGIALLSGCATAPPGADPVASGGINAPAHLDADYLILISFDGFRHDYLDRGITPNFDRLAAAGVRADALIPVFPTKTYTNHYSVATGMYAGRHGLVGNDFYDPEWDAYYRLRDRTAVEDGRWYGGEPIWVTAERQGMVSAAMFFIGTEAPIRGTRPTYWHRYDHDLPDSVRVERVLDWLAMPANRRPHMITLYFAVADDNGHWSGPDSPELDAAVRHADSMLGSLLDGIESLPYGDRVNVITMSDHGMTPSVGTVVLDDYADLDGVIVVDAGPIASLHFSGDTLRRDRVVQGLAAAPHSQAYTRDRIPAEWGVRDNPRIGDVLVVADEGWLLSRAGRGPGRNVATHGWAPTESMYGIFVAAGPGIRPAGRIAAFENIHIYPLMASLLGLRPNPGIDGRAAVLAPVLVGSSRDETVSR